VEVDWVMSDDLKNHIHDKNRKWIHNWNIGNGALCQKI
jgi:hypothetical protein